MQRIDYPPLIQELIRQLRRMPGIGPRSAERIALWIVQKKRGSPERNCRSDFKNGLWHSVLRALRVLFRGLINVQSVPIRGAIRAACVW